MDYRNPFDPEPHCVFAPYGEGTCNQQPTTVLESTTYLSGKVARVVRQPACAEHAAYWQNFYSGFPSVGVTASA